MSFLKGMLYLITASAIFVYTLSYAIYEFKNKNILAGVGVVMICAMLILAPIGVILYF